MRWIKLQYNNNKRRRLITVKPLRKVFNIPLAFVMSSVVGFTFMMYYLTDTKMFKQYYQYMRSFRDVLDNKAIVVMLLTEGLTDEQKAELGEGLKKALEEDLGNSSKE